MQRYDVMAASPFMTLLGHSVVSLCQGTVRALLMSGYAVQGIALHSIVNMSTSRVGCTLLARSFERVRQHHQHTLSPAHAITSTR
jgi:hypothetical protein